MQNGSANKPNASQRLKFLPIFILLAGAFAIAEYNKEVQLTQVLKTDVTTIGQKFIYPNSNNDEVSVMKVTIPPGKETGWHKHSFPVFAYVLKGTLTVEIDKKETMQFTEGASFAEVINTYHNGKNIGTQDVSLIAFFLGEKGQPLSVKQ
jgi:quercetin dioxygenase-like cupin family protein